MLRAIRESGGTALVGVGCGDGGRDAAAGPAGRHQRRPGRRRDAGCARRARRRGQIGRDELVVLFNTGGALKYLDVLSGASARRRPQSAERHAEWPARSAPGRSRSAPCAACRRRPRSAPRRSRAGANATMRLNSPLSNSSTALPPNRVASTRSKLVGDPPRCRWPSTTVRDSLPVSSSSAAAMLWPAPPRRSARPRPAAWMSDVLPPSGLAPSATTMIEKYAPQASRSLICCATFLMSYGISGIRIESAPPPTPA